MSNVDARPKQLRRLADPKRAKQIASGVVKMEMTFFANVAIHSTHFALHLQFFCYPLPCCKNYTLCIWTSTTHEVELSSWHQPNSLHLTKAEHPKSLTEAKPPEIKAAYEDRLELVEC